MDFKIKNNLIEVDKQKLRILTSVKIIDRIKEEINKIILSNWIKDKNIVESAKYLYLAIVTEYPTFDGISLDIEFL